MNVAPLLQALGYRESQKFILPDNLDSLPAGELCFALRHTAHACQELGDDGSNCRFQGAYVLQEESGRPAVPVVYVFETERDAAAREIHRMVWNQNLVPFIIVASPSTVRVYPGFAYSRTEDKPLVSQAAAALSALGPLRAFSGTAIDDGLLWNEWADAANPVGRADESLLRDLLALDQRLQHDGMDHAASHGLIGKFVYLRYLKDRDILSVRKLAKWQIGPEEVFSRRATLRAFRTLNAQLQDWLNGSVFQLGEEALASVTQAQLRLVADVFCGSSPHQLHLDFQAYDFSHIPIETLSCVYEQFLHGAEDSSGQTRGKTLGAYYTPIPLADFLISELDRKRPLTEGMKVLDPACGSGVFLVQCYRRLIEKKIRAEKRRLNAGELGALLTKHIFGLDRDGDACRVAELSLILTLLDYVNPPDLESTTFKLPILGQGNVIKDDFFRDEVRDDFFAPNESWNARFRNARFDWLVGNPPWAEVRGEPAPNHDHYDAWRWITTHKASHPTGGNQIAEAFLWKTGNHLADSGVAGLLVPAMTWFKKESVPFRKAFFSQRRVWCLANFANFMEVLFAGRARSPASAVFFQRTPPSDEDSILTFAPFVAEQVANRPQGANKRAVTWSLVVNGAEMRELPISQAAAGDGLAWKLAMWGSARDARILQRVSAKHESFASFTQQRHITAHQGLELREETAGAYEPLEGHPALAGKKKLLFAMLRGIGRIFAFPANAVGKIHRDEAYVRKRGGLGGLSVSSPPHLIVDASRRFAVFSNEFIFVPPRQIGIAGPTGSENLLRALGLYLSSDFCTYHQFLVSPKWGVDQNLADLDTLKKLPVPLGELSTAETEDWSRVYKELASLSVSRFTDALWPQAGANRFDELLAEMNSRVFKVLGLRPTDRWLIEDFVHLNMDLKQGTVTHEAMRKPTDDELRLYLATLRDCLDGFLTPSRSLRHKIEAVTDAESAMFCVSLQRRSASVPPTLLPADQTEARALLALRDRLRHKHSQWLYFDRALKIYDCGALCQFKPLQRLHWTRRQAVLDADEIIAESLTEGGAS